MIGGFLFPRHVWKFCRRFYRGRLRLGHFQFGIAVGFGARIRKVSLPRGDASLQAVMFGSLFVPSLHVEKRKVRVNELLFWFQLLRFMAFRNGSGILALAVERHPAG